MNQAEDRCNMSSVAACFDLRIPIFKSIHVSGTFNFNRFSLGTRDVKRASRGSPDERRRKIHHECQIAEWA